MTTKQTTHTPGPWHYHLGRGATPRFHIQAEGGYQIASTTELTTPRTAKLAADFDENQAREANARLIAAAPELLEAIEQLANMAGGDGLDYCRSLETFDKHELEAQARFIRGCFMTIVDKARAAISKVRGE